MKSDDEAKTKTTNKEIGSNICRFQWLRNDNIPLKVPN